MKNLIRAVSLVSLLSMCVLVVSCEEEDQDSGCTNYFLTEKKYSDHTEKVYYNDNGLVSATVVTYVSNSQTLRDKYSYNSNN